MSGDCFSYEAPGQLLTETEQQTSPISGYCYCFIIVGNCSSTTPLDPG